MAEQHTGCSGILLRAADVWRVCGFNTSFAPLMMSKMRWQPAVIGRTKAFSLLIARNFYGLGPQRCCGIYVVAAFHLKRPTNIWT